MTDIQTSTAGPTVTRAWQLPGLRRHNVKPRLSRLVTLCCAFKNNGKSFLVESCPDAFIINTDRKPVSYSPQPDVYAPNAVIWPTMDNGVMYAGENKTVPDVIWDTYPGSPPNAATVVSVIQNLLALARSNSPRPSLVVIDTLGGLRLMIQGFVAARAGKATISDMDGRQGYGRVNSIIEGLINDLAGAGYGVWINCHLRHQEVPTMEGDRRLKAVDKFEPDVPDGLWAVIDKRISLVVMLERSRAPAKDAKGTTIVGKYTDRTVLTLNRGMNASSMMSQYGQLPDTLDLPATEPWAFLESEFNRYVNGHQGA